MTSTSFGFLLRGLPFGRGVDDIDMPLKKALLIFDSLVGEVMCCINGIAVPPVDDTVACSSRRSTAVGGGGDDGGSVCKVEATADDDDEDNGTDNGTKNRGLF